MTKIKIAVVDDHEPLLNALVKLFKAESDLDVILTAKNGIDLLEKLSTIMPEIILMDIRMPIMDGIQATKLIRLKYPTLKVIAHTQYDNDDNIVEMYKLGVKSFICKSGDPSELLSAIRTVYKGGNYVTDQALSIFINNLVVNTTKSKNNKSSHLESLGKLSPIELKVLWHTASIKSIKQIAKELHLSPNTVNNHQANIRKKLNLFGRNALAQHAMSVKNRLNDFNLFQNE
jgi:DNA-binding NarL/FixJ family response regulator